MSQTEYEQVKPTLESISSRGEFIERCAVVNEALSWMGTRFHHGARVKKNGDDKGGVDCGEFLIAVYSAVGVMPDYKPKHYSPTWHLHNPTGPELYIDDLRKFAKEFSGVPQPADIAMFHVGRHYAHAVIIIEWPNRIIHAPSADIPGGVQVGDATRDALLLYGGRRFPPRFFSPWTC